MKLIYLAVIIIGIFMSCVCWAELITPEQAMQAVRAFEGNPYLEFSSVELDIDDQTPYKWKQWREYRLKHADYEESIPHYWLVDAVSGEIILAVYKDAYLPEDQRTGTPFGPLTKEQCRQIAEDFARSKYTGFDSMNMVIALQDWQISDGSGWEFRWFSTLPNGASTPNSVSVDVNPADGRIQSYLATRIAPFTPPDPQITAEQAIVAAMAEAGVSEILELDGPSLYATPDGISWSMIFEGVILPENDFCNYFYAKVDAVTGEARVYGADMEPIPYSTDGKSKNTQAKEPEVEYVWIRELVSKLPEASVQWLGPSGALIIYNGTKYTIKPGSRTVKSDQSSITLSSTPELKDGKFMVPVDLLDMLTALQKDKPEPEH